MPRNAIVAAPLPQKTYRVLDDNIDSHVGYARIVDQHGKRTVSMTAPEARFWLQSGAISETDPSPAQKVLLDQVHGIAVDDSVNEKHRVAVTEAAANAERNKLAKREQEHHDSQVAQKKDADKQATTAATAARKQGVPTTSTKPEVEAAPKPASKG